MTRIEEPELEGYAGRSCLPGGVKVIPKMFNISNFPKIVFDCHDTQVHLETRKSLCFFGSQLVAFGPEGLRGPSLDIATGATFPNFTVDSVHP